MRNHEVRLPLKGDRLPAKVSYCDTSGGHEQAVHDVDLDERGESVGEGDQSGQLGGVVSQDCRHYPDLTLHESHPSPPRYGDEPPFRDMRNYGRKEEWWS